MSFRSLAALSLLLLSALAHADGLSQAQPVMLTPPPLDTLPVVDRVVVRKSARQLVLMHGGNIVRSYHVELGLSPIGQTERDRKSVV